MAKYRKVDPRIWNDAKFRALSDHGKLVFLFLLTHPHMTSLGAMRETVPGLAAELGWDEKAFRKAFREGCSGGMVRCNEKACFVWLPNFLKHNGPESPNVIKSWAVAWDLVPECSEKHELYQHLKDFTKGLTKAFREGWVAVEQSLGDHPYPNQEQEQEQEQEKEKPSCQSTRFDGEYLETAKWIYEQIKKINPDHKEPNFEKWANDIRLMHQQDRRTDKDIREMFSWANGDEFWRANILCPGTLRKRWDQLAARRNSDASPKTQPKPKLKMFEDE